MVTSRESPEYRAFQQHFNDLVEVLTPNVSGIATQLFSKELVSSAILDQAHTIGLPNNEKIVHVLTSIRASIGREPGKFGTFVHVLRTNAELCDLAGKLEACRDKIRSDHEASRHVSIMRSAAAVLSSPSVLLRPLGERSFPSLAGSTPSTRIHYPQTDVVRPADLPIGNRKKQSIANTTLLTPSFTRPVPCTDGNEKDTDVRPSTVVVDQASLQKEVIEYKGQIKTLEDALGALRIEQDRKLSEKDLTVNVLSLTVQDQYAERDRLAQEIQDWRTYAQSLVQEMEMLKQDNVDLVEKVGCLEDDRKSADEVHNLEMERMKQQLQAEFGEKKELLTQLEAHHRTAFERRKRKPSKLGMYNGHHTL